MTLLKEGIYRNYEYKILITERGYRNGYVKLPDEHPWIGRHTSEFQGVSVHGGITFSEEGWVGFDCGHVCDLPDPEYIKEEPSETEKAFLKIFAVFEMIHEGINETEPTIKSTEYVEEEIKKLIDQAIIEQTKRWN